MILRHTFDLVGGVGFSCSGQVSFTFIVIYDGRRCVEKFGGRSVLLLLLARQKPSPKEECWCSPFISSFRILSEIETFFCAVIAVDRQETERNERAVASLPSFIAPIGFEFEPVLNFS